MPINLEELDAIPAEEIPAAIMRLSARWIARPAPAPAPAADRDDEGDPMLTTEEAAALLRRSPRWIYRNARKLPFVRRLSSRSMLHSKKGIEKYLASRRS